jgi:hypothetical protein
MLREDAAYIRRDMKRGITGHLMYAISCTDSDTFSSSDVHSILRAANCILNELECLDCGPSPASSPSGDSELLKFHLARTTMKGILNERLKYTFDFVNAEKSDWTKNRTGKCTPMTNPRRNSGSRQGRFELRNFWGKRGKTTKRKKLRAIEKSYRTLETQRNRKEPEIHDLKMENEKRERQKLLRKLEKVRNVKDNRMEVEIKEREIEKLKTALSASGIQIFEFRISNWEFGM